MVARTSDKSSVLDNEGWKVNGAGLEYSSKFGFGVMNADRLVKLAKKYNKKVGEQLIKEIEPTSESTLSTYMNLMDYFFLLKTILNIK